MATFVLSSVCTWFHLHPHSRLQKEEQEQTPVVYCVRCIDVLQQTHGSPDKAFGNPEVSLAATAVVC